MRDNNIIIKTANKEPVTITISEAWNEAIIIKADGSEKVISNFDEVPFNVDSIKNLFNLLGLKKVTVNHDE